ncbi:MAG: PAS domain-containing protein [Acidobacteria bacterium]|nr:PAS domain-containing protein [Acidobacteriota bacterium]
MRADRGNRMMEPGELRTGSEIVRNLAVGLALAVAGGWALRKLLRDRRGKAGGPGPIVASRILDTVHQGVFWKDRASVYLGCNAAFATAVGLDHPSEIIGKTDYDLHWPRADADAYRADDQEVIESGTAKRAILEPLQQADGTRLWCETSKEPLRDDEGRVIGIIGLCTDVTDRRLQEIDLRETRLMLQTVLDGIPVRVFWKDLNSVYLGCNLLFARDAGLERPDDIVGKSDHDLGWSEQADLYRADDRQVMDTNQSKLGYEEPQTTPDGEQIWLRTSKMPLHDLEGEVIGVLGTYEDITASKRAEAEQRSLEAQMLHAQKLESLGILAGGIAHDFNNLLVAMLGHADLALADLPPGAGAHQHVEEIRTAARRARELTNQMLAYSGKGRFVVRSLQLGEVVSEMGHLLEAAIPKKVGLRYRLARDLPAVEADVAQLRQVVMNLVTNAAEAIGEGRGTITLATGQQQASPEYLRSAFSQENLPGGDYVYLEVSDDGCGMDAATRERLFEPFFTTKFQGRGLGLAAVLGIVRGHRGTVKVDSEPGQGSSVKVLFPVGRGEAPTVAEPAPEEEPAGPLRGTVLVVDDEEVVREVTREMLERDGLEVLTAGDGAEAIEVFRERQGQIVLILLDMTMPRMDGEETFRELRRLDPDVRVILMSGYNEQDTTSRFVGKRLAGFLQKPFTLQDLEARLRAALGPPKDR